MNRPVVCGLIAAIVVVSAASSAWTAGEKYIPGIKIVLEVRTPQGDLRSVQRPGFPPTYWYQDLPVVQGDKVTINAMIATGGAELGAVKIRLDHNELKTGTEAAWRVEVNTADLTPGYHLVEVWASTKPPASKENSATLGFLVVPQNDPLLLAIAPAPGEPGPPVSPEEQLACAIRSRETEVDKAITTSSSATVAGPTLFYVSAGPAVKEFFYTLTRDGRVTYTSPRLPAVTSILLEPQKPEGVGLAPGTLILTARAGDGEGRFGAPAWITVHVKALEAAK
jgi:hypothetical protein